MGRSKDQRPEIMTKNARAIMPNRHAIFVAPTTIAGGALRNLKSRGTRLPCVSCTGGYESLWAEHARVSTRERLFSPGMTATDFQRYLQLYRVSAVGRYFTEILMVQIESHELWSAFFLWLRNPHCFTNLARG